MEEIINKEVLFDYFSGRVSPLQKKSVERWLAEPASREQYYQWLHAWELSRLQTNTNWQTAFHKTASRMSDTAPATEQADGLIKHGWQSGRAWLAAASVLLVLGVSGWVFRDALLYQTVQTGFGQTHTLTLPDGSAVTLNANSSLRFPRWFGTPISFGRWSIDIAAAGSNARTVELTGEADFSVRHLPNHRRFVVLTAKGLNVTVLGTQFTVLSRERATRVVLRSGRVQLTTQQPNQPPLMMRPGDLVTLNPRGQLNLTRTAHPETLASWKHQRFTFEQTSLREIADLLHDNYGLTVTIDHPTLADRTISGSFPARDANEVLQLVAQLLQINYIRENDRVTFTD